MASSGQGISGFALGMIGMGALFAYAGFKNYSVPHALQSVIRGEPPATWQKGPASAEASAGLGAAAEAAPGVQYTGGGSVQQILHATAAQFGWGEGAEWQALQAIEISEAGFNPRARNKSSGAFGLAQALGHGTAHTAAADGTNEYGNYGLSDAQNRAANSGDPSAQALWMCRYIKSHYGSPTAAWAYHQANNSY